MKAESFGKEDKIMGRDSHSVNLEVPLGKEVKIVPQDFKPTTFTFQKKDGKKLEIMFDENTIQPEFMEKILGDIGADGNKHVAMTAAILSLVLPSERNRIQVALFFYPNKVKAAEALGLSPRTLFRKIREYKLENLGK